MSQQGQDANNPGQAENPAPLEGTSGATSPPGQAEISAPQEGTTSASSSSDLFQKAENVGNAPLHPGQQAESVGGKPPYFQAEDVSETSDEDMADLQGTTQTQTRATTKQSSHRIIKSDKKKRPNTKLVDMLGRMVHSDNVEGQKGKNGSAPESGTTGPEVKAESSERGDGVRGRPIVIDDDGDANSQDGEDYDAQRDPSYSRFGTPIDTFSTRQHDQGELMYWLMYGQKKHFVVKFGSNDAPKYRIVWDQEWRGKKPDNRLENAKSSKFRELESLDEHGKPVYTWKDVTAIRGVAWIEKNGEGLDGIDPREKIWCSWSVDEPGDDKKPVHQRLKIKDRSKGKRAQAFNYTLIFCEVQKKGSQEKVECVIDRNTYRRILRAGRSAADRKITADITLFIHAEYAEKRHNGKIQQKSASPSRDFGTYLRECSSAPDSWEKRHQEKLDDYEKEEMDEETSANEESGDESDSFDRGTHRTKSKRKESPNYGRGSRHQDKDRLDEILNMLQDLTERVQRLESQGGKSRRSKKRS